MDCLSPEELVFNNFILFEKILGYAFYMPDWSIAAGLMQWRLVNKLWCDTLTAIIFRRCSNKKLMYLKLLVEKGFNNYGHLVRKIEMRITGYYKIASLRKADVITWMKEGPLVNLENVVSIHLKRRPDDVLETCDVDGLSVVLGSCKNVQCITLENFALDHMRHVLVKFKPIMPRARYDISIETESSSTVIGVLEQLTPEIVNSVSLSFDISGYYVKTHFDGIDLIFNSIGWYYQLWSKIESISMDLWEKNKESSEVFRSEHLRKLNPIMGGNMRKLKLLISRPSDEDENPVGIELLRLFKHCFSLTHLKLRVENGPNCTVGDQWIHRFVTSNGGIVWNIRSIELSSLTSNEDEPAFTFDSLRSLKLCKNLDTLILENLMPEPDKRGIIRSRWLIGGHYCRVTKFNLHKLPSKGEVWFPKLTKFDVHADDDLTALIEKRLRYHGPLCKWYIDSWESLVGESP